MQTDCHSDDIEDNEISKSTDLLVSSANVTQLTSPPHGEISYILGIRAPYEVCRGARNSLYVTIDCSDTNLRSILSSRTQSDYPGDLSVILVISVYHHYLTLVHNSSRQKAYSRISSQFLGFLPVLFTIIKSYYYVMRALLSFRNIDMQTSYYCYLHSIHFSFTIYHILSRRLKLLHAQFMILFGFCTCAFYSNSTERKNTRYIQLVFNR